MIRRFPQNRRWDGVKPGTYHGGLYRTWKVDLDRDAGAISLSAKLTRVEDSTELVNLSGDSDRVTAFLRTDADCTDRYWALSGTTLYKTDSNSSPDPTNDWDTDTLANSPTTNIQDFTVHGNDSRNDSGRNKLFVSLDSDISVLNDTGDNVWTASFWVTKHSQPSLDTNHPHPIEYFSNRKITLVGDGNRVHTISRPSDTQNDTVTNSRLVLPKNLIVNSIFCTSERAWIGCFNRRQERGAIVEWDGFSQSPNRIHEITGLGVVAGVNYAGIPLALENSGKFLEYTGNGFTPMRRDGVDVSLVSPEDVGTSLTNGSTINQIGPTSVHPRGIVAGEDGLVYVNVSGSFNGGYGRSWSRLSGIWCLNPITGRLYNKYSLGGTFGDTTDAGHQSLPVATMNHPGGLYWIMNDANLFGRNLLAGGVIASTATVTQGGIWLLEDYVNGFGPTCGHFVTDYIPASEVQELWDSVWIKLRHRLTAATGSTLKIVVKARGLLNFRTTGTEPEDHTITWTSANTFTVTLPAGSSSEEMQEGDEVEVLFGENAGKIAHITSISGAYAALQTVTIDETVGQTSGTSVARFEGWKKIGVFDESNLNAKKLNVGIDSSFIQFKVVLLGELGLDARRLAVEELVVSSSNSVQVEN